MSTALSWSVKIVLFAKFLQFLTNNKWPPRVDPGGHNIVVNERLKCLYQ